MLPGFTSLLACAHPVPSYIEGQGDQILGPQRLV